MVNLILVSNCRRLPQYMNSFRAICRKYSQQHKQPPNANIGAETKSKWKIYPAYFLIKNLRPDKVPGDYLMVYRSSLETYVNFAIAIAMGAVIAVPLGVLRNVGADPNKTTLKSNYYITIAIASVCSLAFASVLLVVGLRCPLRIYYSLEKDNYLMFFPRLFPFRTKCVEVKPGTVLLPKSSSTIFPWTTFQHVHGDTNKKIILIEHNFEMSVYYNKLLKY